MSSRDLVHNLKCTAGWPGATISTATDTDSAVVIDTAGFESVMFAVYSGAITDGTYTLKILETDNADGTTGAAEVAGYQFQDSFSATEDTTVQKVGAVLSKRYCTLRLTSAGTTGGGVFKGAIAILGHARSLPQ
jgi:hypothetical protein